MRQLIFVDLPSPLLQYSSTPSLPHLISLCFHCFPAQRDCETVGVRQHKALEEEAAKASWLGFDASASGAEFEQGVFPIPSVPLATSGSG